VAASPEITTFEITTALAFLYFAQQDVGAAVVEVGLGGRLDATNVCDPLLTVITSISYDHTYLLGETLAEIAGEKAGIIKPQVPIVVSPQLADAREVIERIAAERGAPLIQVGRDYSFELLTKSMENQTFHIRGSRRNIFWQRPGYAARESDHTLAGISPGRKCSHGLRHLAGGLSERIIGERIKYSPGV
jgi:dihydrofolate synthase/folylpolyglutamate synthase